MRNNKKTSILVKEVNTKKRLFLVYRPNTGRQLKLETYADIKKKFKKVQTPSGSCGFSFCSVSSRSVPSGSVRGRQAALDGSVQVVGQNLLARVLVRSSLESCGAVRRFG